MATIFLSYPRQELAFAERLRDALMSAGHKPWMDVKDLLPAEQWRSEIRTNIILADVVLFVLCPASLRSKECQRELSFAGENSKRIIPVLLHAVTVEEVGEPLGSLNWLSVDLSNFDLTMKQILAAINRDLPTLQQGRQLLVEAQRWQDNGNNPSYLLRGNALQQARIWQDRSRTGEAGAQSTALHVQFIEASRRRVSSRQRALLASGLGSTAIIALASILVAVTIFGQNALIRTQNTSLLSQSLSSKAIDLLNNNIIDEGALLSVAASKTDDIGASRSALLATLLRSPFLDSYLESGITAPPDSAVIAQTFAPDSKTLLTVNESAKGSGEVLTWGVASHRLTAQKSLSIPDISLGAMKYVAVSPDARYIAVVNVDDIDVIDARANRVVVQIPDSFREGFAIYGGGLGSMMAISPDDRVIAAVQCVAECLPPGEVPPCPAYCSEPGVVALYSMSGGVPIGYLPLPYLSSFGGPGPDLSIAPDDKSIGIGDCSYGGTCEYSVYSIAQQHLAFNYTTPAESFEGGEVTFSHDGSMFAAVGCFLPCKESVILHWNTNAYGKPAVPAISRLDVGLGGLLALNSNGSIAVVSTDTGTLRLWNLLSDQGIGDPLVGHPTPVSHLTFAPDGQHFASVDENNDLLLWRVTPYAEQNAITYSAPADAFYARDGTLITVPPEASQASLTLDYWNAATYRQTSVFTIPAPANEVVTSYAMSANGAYVATQTCPPDSGTAPGPYCQITTWDVTSKRQVNEQIIFSASYDAGITLSSVSNDGHYVVASCNVLDTTTAQTAMQVQESSCNGASSGAPSGASSWSGSLLAIASSKGCVFWNASTGQAVQPLQGTPPPDEIDVEFSNDGRMLALMEADGTVTLWDMSSGTQISTLPAQPTEDTTSTHVLDFSQDGRSLATLYGDITGKTQLTVWHVAQHITELGPFLLAQQLRDVSLSPDGTQIALSGLGPNMSLVLLPIDERLLRQSACAIANRALTTTEWSLLVGSTAAYQLLCSTSS